MARNHKIQLRRDTEANWTSTDPVLAEGEVGLVTDTNELVVGDGATAFSSLARFIDKATASGTYVGQVVYDGDLGADRPIAGGVVMWVDFPSDPTNATADDIVLSSDEAPLTLDASDFTSPDGSAVLGAPSSGFTWPVWEFSQGVLDLVMTTVTIPDGWSTVNVKANWTNLGAGSGDVVWRLDHSFKADGGTINAAPTNGSDTAATAPAQDVWETTTLASGITVTADSTLGLRVYRRGAHASDNLANDAGLISLSIEKAS